MLKELIERRNELQEKMESILENAKVELRALTTEETEEFDTLESEIRNIDATIEREERASQMEKKDVIETETRTQEELDIEQFASFVRGTDVNMTKGDNGAIIPQTIMNKILDKLENICPIYAMATKYNAKGKLLIPKVDASTDHITVAYANEFEELESHANKFSTIELNGFLFGALTKISKSLINNTDINVTNFVVEKMAYQLKKFLESELLFGSQDKISGILRSYDATNMKLTMASKTAIDTDELIALQDMVIDAYQPNACWLMSPATRTAIRQLKDGNGVYLLERDFYDKGKETLLGKPVYVSDEIDDLGSNKYPLFYGDFSGLAIKTVEEGEAQILTEKFATQHAIGVVLWGELDAKVENTQKIAVAKCPA